MTLQIKFYVRQFTLISYNDAKLFLWIETNYLYMYTYCEENKWFHYQSSMLQIKVGHITEIMI